MLIIIFKSQNLLKKLGDEHMIKVNVDKKFLNIIKIIRLITNIFLLLLTTVIYK